MGFLVHALVEIWFIGRLTAVFAHYSLGYSWGEWFTIHKYFSIILFVLGALTGYIQGKYWWRVVYDQKRLDPFFKKFRNLFRT